ncbi:MAG: replication-relaxation family protein [Candidatus Obscuribacterales bacterium]|nr:replication-relaxation family protein [Candidatus Obscuribacterales bacterium]
MRVRAAAGKAKKKGLVVMDRDVESLSQLYVHRTLTSGQLARLAFGDISYETARKRMRRLMQANLIGCASSERSEGRGRPELLYYLTQHGAHVLEQKRVIDRREIPIGPAHTYHKEHFLKLADICISLKDAEDIGLIRNFAWLQGEDFASQWAKQHGAEMTEHPDAAISFAFPKGEQMIILLELDTGNFRQTRHWEPKIVNFLFTGHPIWVVANSETRIATLSEWTLPLLTANGVGAGKCVFAVFSEIMEGILAARWFRADGTLSELRPK